MKRVVIYTAIFGSKDNLLEPEFIPLGCDFVCFTDSNNFKSKVWQIKKMPRQFDDPVRDAKIFKILPHRFFPDYEYSIWIDGNMKVRGDINKLINKYLSSASVAFYDHAKLPVDSVDCLYREAEILIEMGKKGKYKDDPKIILKQIEKYRNLGYPEKNGLISGMIILRRHNDQQVKKSMEDWWQEIQNHSRRDQLSFNYVAWKNRLDFVYIDGDSRNNDYFIWATHKESLKNRIIAKINSCRKFLS